MRFRSGLVGEEIDGEVVMIDLASGIYYSLRGSAVFVWRQIKSGTSEDDLLTALLRSYDAPTGVIEDACAALLAALRGDGLLVDGGEVSDASPSPGDRVPFEPMQLERFDDMAHVILLDPVHDVDPERGWPLPVD